MGDRNYAEFSETNFNKVYTEMGNNEKWLLVWSSLATLYAQRIGQQATGVINNVLSQYLIDAPPPEFFAWELIRQVSEGPKKPSRAADDLEDEIGLPPITVRH